MTKTRSFATISPSYGMTFPPLYVPPFFLCLFLHPSAFSKPFSMLEVIALIALLNGHRS